MSNIAKNLRSHLESNGMKLHPEGEYFDPIIHPTRRGAERFEKWNAPDLALTYHGKEDHDQFAYHMFNAMDHVASGKDGAEGYNKDEENYEESPYQLSRKIRDGYGHSTYRVEDGANGVYHVEHHTYKHGTHDKLGLEGTNEHHFAVFKLY